MEIRPRLAPVPLSLAILPPPDALSYADLIDRSARRLQAYRADTILPPHSDSSSPDRYRG